MPLLSRLDISAKDLSLVTAWWLGTIPGHGDACSRCGFQFCGGGRAHVQQCLNLPGHETVTSPIDAHLQQALTPIGIVSTVTSPPLATAIEYIKRVWQECVPRTHPDFDPS